MPGCGPIDVHQHLWPPALVDALRGRRRRRRTLRGWTLHTAGEAPYEIGRRRPRPRRRAPPSIRTSTRALVSLSAPLGIEYLPPDEAAPLLDAWHRGVARAAGAVPGLGRGRASSNRTSTGWPICSRPDSSGLQVSATALGSPPRSRPWRAVLRPCEQSGRPVLVHPGPRACCRPHAALVGPRSSTTRRNCRPRGGRGTPSGARLFPDLRVCFVAGAGLAPLHHERFAARGGRTVRRRPRTCSSTPPPTGARRSTRCPARSAST